MLKILNFIVIIAVVSPLAFAQDINEFQQKYEQLERERDNEISNSVRFKGSSDQITVEALQNNAIGLFGTLKTSYGTLFDLMADQTTTTNLFRSFWRCA